MLDILDRVAADPFLEVVVILGLTIIWYIWRINTPVGNRRVEKIWRAIGIAIIGVGALVTLYLLYGTVTVTPS